MATIKTEATVEDLYNAPDDGMYEIVDGMLIRIPPTGDEPNYVAGEIAVSLRAYARETGRGRARVAGVAYLVDLPNRKSFSPHASYSPTFRRGNRGFVEGAPLFAVEVRSESDYSPTANRAYARKRADYFAAGTEIVWDVDVVAKTVSSYRHNAPDEPVIFRSGDIADAEPALPGWRIAIDDIFSDA